MTPCSSGNSPTMPVDEIGLGEPAARAALCRIGAGTCGARSFGELRRSRADLVEHVPSLAWKTRSLSFGTRRSSVTLRSWSQKNGVGQPRAQHALVAGDDRLPPSSRASCWRRRESAAPARRRRRGRRNISGACASRCEHLGRHVHERAVDRPAARPAIRPGPYLVEQRRRRAAARAWRVAARFEPATDQLAALAPRRARHGPSRSFWRGSRRSHATAIATVDRSGGRAVTLPTGRRRRSSGTTSPSKHATMRRVQRPHPAEPAPPEAHRFRPGQSRRSPRATARAAPRPSRGRGARSRRNRIRPCRSRASRIARPGRARRD